MTEENYWYSSLEPPLEAEAVAEAKTIVDAFRAREIPIEIGGFPDDAEEDDDLHPGGIAFMYAKDRILAREPYLGGEGERTDSTNSARQEAKGILEVLQRTRGFEEVEVSRVVSDIVLIDLNPPRTRTLPLLGPLKATVGPLAAASPTCST